MAILYYLVFCSALLKLSCYTPRNYFLATDWDAVTAVSVSENIHVQWRQQETIGVRAGGARGAAAPPKFGQLRFFGQQEKIWAKLVFKDVSMFIIIIIILKR